MSPPYYGDLKTDLVKAAKTLEDAGYKPWVGFLSKKLFDAARKTMSVQDIKDHIGCDKLIVTELGKEGIEV